MGGGVSRYRGSAVVQREEVATRHPSLLQSDCKSWVLVFDGQQCGLMHLFTLYLYIGSIINRYEDMCMMFYGSTLVSGLFFIELGGF